MPPVESGVSLPKAPASEPRNSVRTVPSAAMRRMPVLSENTVVPSGARATRAEILHLGEQRGTAVGFVRRVVGIPSDGTDRSAANLCQRRRGETERDGKKPEGHAANQSTRRARPRDHPGKPLANARGSDYFRMLNGIGSMRETNGATTAKGVVCSRLVRS